MPSKLLLSWDRTNLRWRVQYKGRRFVVSCRQLGAPGTKEGSYQAANAWWAAKQAEVDGEEPPHPLAEDIAITRRMRDNARRRGDNAAAEFFERNARLMETHPEHGSFLAKNRELNRNILFKKHYNTDFSNAPDELIDLLLWRDLLEENPSAPVPDGKTAEALVERFLELRKAQHDSGQLSSSEYDLVRLCLSYFGDWFGGQLPLDQLDADRWEEYWEHLIGCKVSVEYKKKRLRHAREFVEWAASKGVLTLPPNIQSRRHRFGKAPRAVPTLTLAEVRTLVDAAPGSLKDRATPFL